MTYLKDLKNKYMRLDKAVKEEEYRLKCVREDKLLHIKKGIELNLIEMRLQNVNNNKIIEDSKRDAWQAFIQEPDPKKAKKIKSVYKKWCKELSHVMKIQAKHLKNVQKNQKEYIYKCNILLLEKDYEVDSPIWNLSNEQNEAYNDWKREKRLNDIAKANITREKALSSSRMESPMEDMCGICLEKHITKDTIVTNCNHQFGESCFQRWRECCYSSETHVSCPMCKKTNPKIFNFIVKNAQEK